MTKQVKFIQTLVAVLPKKEGFIYPNGLRSRNNHNVAVLPKKEGFIYQKDFGITGHIQSQSYPKRRGSSILCF